MNELALFAGAGGGILGGHLLGWTTVCAVEIEPFPREVLLARQRDGLLPRFPVWDDICSFDGRPWRGLVDVVSGGFPCQDISAAGYKAGIDGENSGLWAEMLRVICEVRPRYAFMENASTLNIRGLSRVLGDLAEVGYNAVWSVLSAAALGAPHRRERTWVLGEDASHANGERCEKQWRPWSASEAFASARGCSWWGTEPSVGRVAPRMANRVDRLKALGNGQVPAVAATAFMALQQELRNYATNTHF